MRQKEYYEVYLDDYDKVIASMSRNSYEGVSNKFYLKDDQGHLFDLHIRSIETTQNNYNKYILALYDPTETGVEYQVMHQHARDVVLECSGIVKTERFDERFFYNSNDLGYTYDRDQTAFALWAPTASRVKLEVYKSDRLYTYEVKRTGKGIYHYIILENLENATYVYLIQVNSTWRESIGPYGTASTEDSRRSAIVGLDKIRVRDVPLPKMTSACDIIIYETSVRDFTMQKGIGVTMPGKFRGFVEENEITKQQYSGFSYLKTLEIIHIRLMPVTDFGSVNENYPLMRYNWGCNPVRYHVLEGGFSTEPTNPYGRVLELTRLMEECHRQGIRVNLDAVFSHVYDKETHAFENTVSNYYFQMNENGDFSSGTYCGNDVDSRRNMYHKYIVNACTYLVRTCHVDDFRFDLMGVLDAATINAVHEACKTLNPDFIVYNESQDMPNLLDSGKRASISNNAQMPYVARFSNRFRDVIKGRTNANEVSVKGYCTGAVCLLDVMRNCPSGNYIDIGMKPIFTHPRNAISYVECHDNMTSWDKLKECCKEDSKEVRTARAKMLMAVVLLAQDTPFIHSGQELARSKRGLPNTYEESDGINKLDYLHRNQHQDTVEITKDLARVRREHPILHYSMKEDVEQHMSFSDIARKILLYKIRDEYDDTVIIFNPTGECFSYELEAAYPLLYYNEAPEDIPIKKVGIELYSTTVFSRNDFLKPGV